MSSLIHSLIHSLTHSPTHSLAYSLNHSPQGFIDVSGSGRLYRVYGAKGGKSHFHRDGSGNKIIVSNDGKWCNTHSLIHSSIHSLTLSLIHSLTPILPAPFVHSLLLTHLLFICIGWHVESLIIYLYLDAWELFHLLLLSSSSLI